MPPQRCVGALAAVVIALGLTAACGSEPPKEATSAAAAAESPVAVNEKWRAKHEADYRRDWVTIAGLHPLKPGANSAGSAATNDIVLPASGARRRWPLRPPGSGDQVRA